MNNEHNIPPFDSGNGGKEKLSENKIMAYLEGRLSPSEQHEVELWLSEEGMEGDAIEGLHTLVPADTQHIVNKLKHELYKRTAGKKRRRRPLRADPYTWLAVGIILLLVVVAYIVVRIAKK